MTLQNQISLFTEDRSTYSPEDFHASHLVPRVIEKEKMMSDFYFMKCLGRLERLNRCSSWLKMFLECLHLNFQGLSPRYVHHWKTKGTKFNRLLFQLQRLTHLTRDTGYGLLPTPKATEIEEDYTEWKKR